MVITYSAKNPRAALLKDALILAGSIALAILLVRSGIIHAALDRAGQYALVGSFVAGICFASLFTVAPAVAVLAEIGQTHSPILVALIGGAGAVLGDLIIFKFMRDRVSLHLAFIIQKIKSPLFAAILRHRAFKWLLPFIGALIIASPFPDELGLALMGLSHIKTRIFIPLSFGLNATGILIIILVSRATGL
ncbi:MAG: hypothetical protein HY422_03105 [Candidatus Komeilibacteria bacterium]|nr:hypothetical protein [Candidatus Komeilibacteria bacterium]